MLRKGEGMSRSVLKNADGMKSNNGRKNSNGASMKKT